MKKVLGRRKPAINESDLSLFEKGDCSPLWKAYKLAFEKFFNEIDQEVFNTLIEGTGCLYNFESSEKKNWEWYVPLRINGSRTTDNHYTESKLHNIIFEENKRLVYLHGHTGVGKSTLLLYFFQHYIPQLSNFPKSRLKKLVPYKIPLLFFDLEKLEENWDLHVCDFLYFRFDELVTEKFIKNLARHILYPNNKFKLHLTEDGDLLPTSVANKFRDYQKDTERLIKETYKGCDRNSAINWIKKHILSNEEINLGAGFTKYVIQLLAKHYGYEFILIVDNIDQIPLSIQREICRLVYFKMEAYRFCDSVKFIITARESFLEPIYSGTFLNSYPHYILEEVLPLPFSEVLIKRKVSYFDKNIEKCSQKIEVEKGVFFTVQNTNDFIMNVILQFDNTKKIKTLHKLANHNIRNMLKIVESIFYSPLLSLEMLALIIDYSTKRPTSFSRNIPKSFLAHNRIIDILVRASNNLIAKKSHSLLPNIYYSGQLNHFSSTLCRLFIIKIVNSERAILYNKIKIILIGFGHKLDTINKAINDLLLMEIIFSNFGIHLDETNIVKQKLETRDLPYGEYLVEEISTSLRYMQGVSYITPLQEEYLEGIKIPESIHHEIKHFNDRVLAASSLYKQIRSDFNDQLNYLKENDSFFVEFKKFGLQYTIQNIREQIEDDLNRIDDKKNFDYNKNNFNELFPELPIDDLF